MRLLFEGAYYSMCGYYSNKYGMCECVLGGEEGEIIKYGCHGWVEMGEQGMRERRGGQWWIQVFT